MTILSIIPILFNLLIVDAKTKEPLTGVRVQTDKAIYYTDFYGSVDIPNNEKVYTISYVSYQSVDSLNTNRDTIVKLLEK
jgi:hypothetical protein